MIELIGYLAAMCFALSGIPFAYRTYKDGRTDASLSGIMLILFGSLGMYVYEASTAVSIPQLADFLIVFVCWSIVLKYRVAPRYTPGLPTDWLSGQWYYTTMVDGSVWRRRRGEAKWQLVR